MKILDTTLRDGSYIIDFAFTAEQTHTISTQLDSAGIDYVEIGHGVGLNASLANQGIAAETDVAYMQAVSGQLKTAKWGMFAIPGICDLGHLDTCIEHDMDFLRFGVSIDSYEKGFPFVEKAKANGLQACVNFMKSYVSPPIEFEKAARAAVAAGADYVYIVDSAGNMTPKQVRQYCERIADLPIGFHGHNNLGLAMANALEATDCGAAIIDTSLQGMGRCTGNTMTEHFIALMQRDDKFLDVDLLALLDVAETDVRPLLTQTGHDSVDLICGYAGFHSSYMNVIRTYALKYDVDPRQLIIELCKVDRSSAPESLVDELAQKLRASNAATGFAHRFPLAQYFGNEQDIL